MLQSLMVYPNNNHFNITPHIDENFVKYFDQPTQQQQQQSSEGIITSTSSSPTLEYSILSQQQQQQQQQQISTNNTNNSSSSPVTMIKTETFDDHNLDYLMYSDNSSQYQPHSQMNRPATVSLFQQQQHHQQQQQQHAQQLRLQHNRMLEQQQQQQQYPFQYQNQNQILTSTTPSSSSILINTQNNQQQQSVYTSAPISMPSIATSLPTSTNMFSLPLSTITSPTSSNPIPTSIVNSTIITPQPQQNPFVAKVQAQTRTITPHPASPKRKREISETSSASSPVATSASISSPSLLSNKKIAIESLGSPVLVGVDPSRSSSKYPNGNGYTNSNTSTTTPKINSNIPILPLTKENEINYLVNNNCTKFDSDSSLSSTSSRTGIKPSGNLTTIAISPKGPKSIQPQHPLAHANFINSTLMVPSNHHHPAHLSHHQHHQHPQLPFPIPVYHPNPGNVTHPRRAAQNRAAQRTFRNRRKAYIKDLETKAVELERSKNYIQSLETENDSLWDRFQTLERLIADSGLNMPTFESNIERVRKPKDQDNNNSDNNNKSDHDDNKGDSLNNNDDDEYDGQGDHDYDLSYQHHQQQQQQNFPYQQQRSTFLSDDDYDGQHALDLDLTTMHHLNVHHS